MKKGWLSVVERTYFLAEIFGFRRPAFPQMTEVRDRGLARWLGSTNQQQGSLSEHMFAMFRNHTDYTRRHIMMGVDIALHVFFCSSLHHFLLK